MTASGALTERAARYVGMAIIDRNNAHHGERDGRFAVKPKRTGNTAKLGADVEPEDSDFLYEDNIARGRRLGDISEGTQIGSQGHLMGKTIGNVRIGGHGSVQRGSVLENAIVGDRVYVGTNSSVGVTRGDDDPHAGAITRLGDFVSIGNDATVTPGCVLGDGARVKDGSTLVNMRADKQAEIGIHSRVANVHIPAFGGIHEYATIDDPTDMFTISESDEKLDYPTVIAHRVTLPGSNGRSSARVTVANWDFYDAVDVLDPSDIQRYREKRYIRNEGTVDSPDGTHEGIMSILDDPQRLEALRNRVRPWTQMQSRQP